MCFEFFLSIFLFSSLSYCTVQSFCKSALGHGKINLLPSFCNPSFSFYLEFLEPLHPTTSSSWISILPFSFISISVIPFFICNQNHGPISVWNYKIHWTIEDVSFNVGGLCLWSEEIYSMSYNCDKAPLFVTILMMEKKDRYPEIAEKIDVVPVISEFE